MKISGNFKLLLRLIIIPGTLLLILLLILKGPAWISTWFKSNVNNSPEIESFSILMPKGYAVHGIDVSKHQGNIDWKRVSRMKNNGIRISFAFIKATEGITRQDEKFEINWKHAEQNGILRGAYHFYYPSRDADKQADNFIANVKLLPGDLPPVADIEYTNGRSAKKIREGLKVFLLRLEKYYKVKPVIYTNTNYYNTYLRDNFDEYPLWIAGYYDHDRFYNEFVTPWYFWQHSEKGNVDGIRGKVDFNVFNGNLQKLKNMTIKK